MTYTEKQTETLSKPGALGILLAPVAGLAYVIALPFIALGTLAALLAKRLLDGILGLVSYAASFAWRPSEAYLGGKKKGKKSEQNTEKE